MLIFNEKIKKVTAFIFILFFCVGFIIKTPVIIAQDPCTTDSDGDGLVDGMDPINDTTSQTNPNIINCNELQNTQNDSDVTYTLLEPIGDLSKFNATQPCPLVDYINKFIKIFLGICAALAMVMIVVGGLQYMTSELLSSKEAGVKQIQGAAFGFIMALAAYAILNTVNADLLNFCPHIPDAKVTVVEDISDEATTLTGGGKATYHPYKAYSPNNACPGQPGKETSTCVKMNTTNLPKKYDQSLEKDTLDKMVIFDNIMRSKGIVWYVTEGWPASSSHKSSCHGNGTCLDLNTPNATPETVKLMIGGLIAVGMCPNYEILQSGGITREQLNAIGIPDARIWVTKGTGAHIHVVNARCGS